MTRIFTHFSTGPARRCGILLYLFARIALIMDIDRANHAKVHCDVVMVSLFFFLGFGACGEDQEIAQIYPIVMGVNHISL